MSLHRQTTWVWKKRSLTGVARFSLPAILAFTEEISHQVSTCSSIMTGVGAAVIDVWWRHQIECDLWAAYQTHHHTLYDETWIERSNEGGVGLSSPTH